MNQAVSYAYEGATGGRPSLYDQFEACRTYAQAQGYNIVGEFNDIDTPGHPSQGEGLAAVRSLLAGDPTLVVLIYQPDPDLHDLLTANNVRVVSVSPLTERAASNR